MNKLWSKIAPVISPGIRTKLAVFTLIFVSALLASSFLFSYIQQRRQLSESFREKIEAPLKLVEDHVTSVYRLAEGFVQLETFRINFEKQKRELAQYRQLVAVKDDSFGNRWRGVIKTFGASVKYTYQMRAFDTYYSTYLTDKNLKEFETKVLSALETELGSRAKTADLAELKRLSRSVAQLENKVEESGKSTGKEKEARRNLLGKLKGLFKDVFGRKLDHIQFAEDSVRIVSFDTLLTKDKGKFKEPVRLFDTNQKEDKVGDKSEGVFENAQFQSFFEDYYSRAQEILSRSGAPAATSGFWQEIQSYWRAGAREGQTSIDVTRTPFEIRLSPIFSNFPVVERARRIIAAEKSKSETHDLLEKFAAVDLKYIEDLKTLVKQKNERFVVLREKGIPPFRDPEFMNHANEYKKTVEKRDSELAKAIDYSRREAKRRNALESVIKEANQSIGTANAEIAKLAALRKKVQAQKPPKDAPTTDEIDRSIQEHETTLEKLQQALHAARKRVKGIRDDEELVLCESLISLRNAALMATVRLTLNSDEDELYQQWANSERRQGQMRSFQVLRQFVYDSKSETQLSVPAGVRSPLEGGVLKMTRSDAEDYMHLYDTTPIKDFAHKRFSENLVGFNLAIINKSEGEERIRRSTLWLIGFSSVVGVLAIIAAWFFSGFAVRRIASLSSTSAEVRDGNLQVTFNGKGYDELATLGQDLNSMVHGLKEREELKGEMAAAEEIQKRLLPANVPANLAGRADIAGFYKAMVGIGGDYFDYLALGNEHVAIAMGDVSNHGVGPALVMAMTRAQLHSLLREKEISLKSIMVKLNGQLYEETPAQIFVTFWLAHYNLKTGELSYISAGHSKPLVYRAATGTTEFLDAGGMPLGMDENDFFSTTLELRKTTLAKGDVFLQYTDGLSEAMNPEREQYGYDRMEVLLKKLAAGSAAQILEGTATAVEEFTGTTLRADGPSELSDDIALVCLKRASG